MCDGLNAGENVLICTEIGTRREEEDNSDQAYAIRHIHAENSKPVDSRWAWQ